MTLRKSENNKNRTCHHILCRRTLSFCFLLTIVFQFFFYICLPSKANKNDYHFTIKKKRLHSNLLWTLLTLNHKHYRVWISKMCLAKFSHNSNKFLRRYVKIDETWISETHTHNTNQRALEKFSPGKRAPWLPILGYTRCYLHRLF